MQNIYSLHKQGFLTDQQLITAYRFSKDPRLVEIPPSIYNVLHSLIISGTSIETYEKKKGLPGRSAKALLGLCLNTVSELILFEFDSDIRAELDEVLAADDDATEMIHLCDKYGFTAQEAQVFVHIKNSRGRLITKQHLFNHLYFSKSSDELPSIKSLDVLLSKMRKKLENTLWRIDTKPGGVLKLERRPSPNYNPKDIHLVWYYMHTYMEDSMRSIATNFDVAPSTVHRAIYRINQKEWEDDALDSRTKDAYREYMKLAVGE